MRGRPKMALQSGCTRSGARQAAHHDAYSCHYLDLYLIPCRHPCPCDRFPRVHHLSESHLALASVEVDPDPATVTLNLELTQAS